MSPSSALTLYDIEDDLLALVDSEESVPAEMEEQFRSDLARALVASKDKRERSARGILQDDASAAFARKEAQRIGEWARGREARAERKRAYVLAVIGSMDRDKKGKFAKLEGHTVTMSARACPASVDIVDGSLVPLDLKMVCVTLPAWLWKDMEQLVREEEELLAVDLDLSLKAIPPSYSIDKAELRKRLEQTDPCANCDATGSLAGAIECEACGATGRVTQSVPGARLVTDKYTLQVK